MPEKLYLKIACSVCRGKVIGCYYCDEQGKHHIEASDKAVARWLSNLPEEEKEQFREALEGK
jgi:hypothetical protein